MFSDVEVKQIVKIAEKNRFPAAALLAVTQIESAGKTFALVRVDGRSRSFGMRGIIFTSA